VPSSTDPRIGSELFGYRIDALVGRGGMGVVYRAYDARLKRNVALKLIAPQLSGDARFRERFLAETELAASLEHPNVIPIHDAGEVDGHLYLAMRYVEGGELRALLREHGPLEPGRAVAICGQVSAALDAAHARGLVHGDVKPSNVLLDEAAHAYLADFGLSRRLADRGVPGLEGFSVGTPAYVSPEQIEGGDVDGRADTYALGCLLYECLTGEPPFPGDSELGVFWAHIQEPPPAASAHKPDLPIEIDAVIATAMAKNRDDRYTSCSDLVEAASVALGLRQPVAIRERKRLLVTIAGLALVAAAVLAAVLLGEGGGPGGPSTKPTLAPNADSLQRIDPRTNKLIATIRPGTNVGALAAGEGAVWATGESDGSLLRIDPEANAVSARGSAGAAEGGPSYPAAGAGAVWISNTGREGVTQVDVHTLRFLQTVSMRPYFNCGPIAIDEGRVWAMASGRLFRVTVDEVSHANVLEGGCPQPGGIAVGNGAVWIAASGANDVLRLDADTMKVTAMVPLGFLPSKLAAVAGGVWVINRRDQTVVWIDRRTNRVGARLNVGRGPDAIAAGAGSVWVANNDDGTVSRIDTLTQRIVATVRVGPHPSDLAVGEGSVWVLVHPN
jgi:serine/threonine-protein kinase